jgi:hypothetical protein
MLSDFCSELEGYHVWWKDQRNLVLGKVDRVLMKVGLYGLDFLLGGWSSISKMENCLFGFGPKVCSQVG